MEQIPGTMCLWWSTRLHLSSEKKKVQNNATQSVFFTTRLSQATKLWILPMTQNPSSFCFRKSNQVAMTRHPATAWSITVTDYRGHNNFIIGGRRRRFCHLIQFSFEIYYLQNISPGNGIVNISWERKFHSRVRICLLVPLELNENPNLKWIWGCNSKPLTTLLLVAHNLRGICRC